MMSVGGMMNAAPKQSDENCQNESHKKNLLKADNLKTSKK
jgi:hypothetical protein